MTYVVIGNRYRISAFFHQSRLGFRHFGFSHGQGFFGFGASCTHHFTPLVGGGFEERLRIINHDFEIADQIFCGRVRKGFFSTRHIGIHNGFSYALK